MAEPAPIALPHTPGLTIGQAQQTVDRRRAVAARAWGIGLLALAAILFYLFVNEPMGTLPGNPQSWRGGPLILGTAFLAIFGAFLIVLRRFSLAAFVVAGLASGVLATCAHAYVYNIMDTATRQLYYDVPEKETKAFVERSRAALTPARLSSFAMALYNDGYLPNGIDYDSLSVGYGGNGINKEVVSVSLNFSYSSFVHPNETGARTAVTGYANLVNLWIASRLNNEKWDPVATARYAIVYSSWPPPAGTRVEVSQFCYLLAINRERNSLTSQPSDELKARIKTMKWLYEWEADAEFKTFLGETLKELEKIEHDAPIVH